MTISEQAKIATAIERLADTWGWGKLCDGWLVLCREYYEGEADLLAEIELGMLRVRNALTARCPDAPASHQKGG